MYHVSDDYLNAMHKKSRSSKIRGKITFTDGTTMILSQSDFADGSLSIEKNCLDNDYLDFGSVITGSLAVGLRTRAPRYKFFGAKISITYSLLIHPDSDVWEDVPLGTYVVASAETSENVVSLTAYDVLKDLDTKLGITEISGTPYEILAEVSRNTGIELAFTADDIASWVNSNAGITVNSESGCSTYRDVVKVATQPLGAFAYATRDDKLALRRFNDAPVRTLTSENFYSVLIADYECWYNSLSITGMRGTFEVGAEPKNGGIDLVIDDAPAWDFGVKDVLNAQVYRLFHDYLEGIRYTPIEMSCPNDPSFECGDHIIISTSKGDVETIITNYTWRFGSPMDINSEGTNPYLDNVSDSTIGSSRINNNKSASNEMTIYEFTNSHAVELGREDTEVALCRFFTTRETFILSFVTIQLKSEIADVVTTTNKTVTAKTQSGVVTPIYDANGNPLTLTCPVTDTTAGHNDVTIKFSLDGEWMPDEFVEQVHDGNQVITIGYPIPLVEPNVPHDWRIFMKTNGGIIEVPVSTLKGVIFGSGLLANIIWDGNIEVEDTYTLIQHTHGVFNYDDSSLVLDEKEVDFENFSDEYSLVNHTHAKFNYADELDIITRSIEYDIISADGEYQIHSSDGEYYIGTSE